MCFFLVSILLRRTIFELLTQEFHLPKPIGTLINIRYSYYLPCSVFSSVLQVAAPFIVTQALRLYS